MKVGVIGATGKAGQKIVQEAISRGLDVTAIVRDANKVTENIATIEKDVLSLTKQDVEGFDVLVNAFGAPLGSEEQHVVVGKHLIELLEGTNIRLIVVGGAGSLYVDEAKTVRVVETPDFPEMFVPTASNQLQNLLDLEKSTINWTFLSPSAFFDPEGPRTGKITLGKDHLLVNSTGESYVSYGDLAIALVDEIQNAAHVNQRFTVTSEKA
ncbi:putative NADH-flavin reductase [Lysinibacillus composti]|uniref:NAD(P)-dependent oxidoreductase n=1 Tax=Lysinibacillus composti TaxID=720633 RepID=A0A3N9UA39_9BACI|nr:NAD(P)-dependent oxidoreductase [Lysinibacillus composti]MBM7609929.1 putative NADH-flavin reductase [Lysinibacillus composti]RQW73459.1 NAD(P)-dependent oxidoreductase [Lysinibacillus composti]